MLRRIWLIWAICFIANAAVCAENSFAHQISGEQLMAIHDNLENAEREAYTDYFNSAAGTSVKSVEKLVTFYINSAQQKIPPDLAEHLVYEEMLARGRLSILYRQLKMRGEAEQQVAEALLLSNVATRKPIQSEDELLSLLNKEDDAIRKNYQK